MSEFKTDAQESLWLSTQLELVTSEVDKQYPELAYANVVPVDTSADEGAETLVYRMFDTSGAAKIMADDAQDSPSVDAFGEDFTAKVKEIGNHWTITQKEIRNGAFAGKSLDTARAMATALYHEKTHDDIAIKADGTPGYGGLFGIVYNPNVSKVAAVAGATSTNIPWSGKTADEIIKDIVDQYNKVIADTGEVNTPNAIALSRTKLSFLQTKKAGIDNFTSIANHIQDILNITFVTHPALENMAKNPATLAGGSFNVMIMYWRDPVNVKYWMPMPYKTYPQVNTGRGFKVETASSSAGVEIKWPLSVVIFYGF